jgi:hypothetical protein
MAKSSTSNGADPPQASMMALSRLHFSPNNPRFAEEIAETDETKLLDRIVSLFTVDDVISSIAVNGYMSTEPLVGIELPRDAGVEVLEGNRRLAALLILSNDPRAKNQIKLREAHPLADGATIDPVPIIVYKKGAEPKRFLAYLGVRHIVGSKAWDSFAKAAWVANMLETHGGAVSIENIEQMTGDTRGTISRLLEGFYLVKQLKDTERYLPNESFKKGRGSAVQFPFSWVYNALGYANVKHWVGMRDRIAPNPVPKKYLDQSTELMVFMFGRKSSQTEPAIKESRQIGDLASCLGDEKMVAQLRNGKKVAEVLWSSQSGLDRVLQSVAKADDALSDALGSVSELTIKEVDRVEPPAKIVRTKARSLYDQLLDRKKADDE